MTHYSSPITPERLETGKIVAQWLDLDMRPIDLVDLMTKEGIPSSNKHQITVEHAERLRELFPDK